jgi:probable F420-dependent oxidoreductase
MGDMTTADRKFRFGLVTAFAPNAQAWTGFAQRAEELGYSSVMVPDTGNTFSPFPAMAAAAAATTTLWVGSFVLNAPGRQPESVAVDALTLDILSGGRLELGVGTGRDPEQGGTPKQRLSAVAAVIDAVKQTFASGVGPMRAVQEPHPPILVAAHGKRALTLAAEQADIVTLAIPPNSTEDHLIAKAQEFRELAGSRLEEIELAANLIALGDRVPEWMLAQAGETSMETPDNPAALLSGTPQQMADTLRRRRELTGISYVTVNSAFMDQLAPVVELLAGE